MPPHHARRYRYQRHEARPRRGRRKIRPAGLRHPAQRVILPGGADGAAVEALRVARDLAIQQVEINWAEPTVLRLAVAGERLRLRQTGGAGWYLYQFQRLTDQLDGLSP